MLSASIQKNDNNRNKTIIVTIINTNTERY